MGRAVLLACLPWMLWLIAALLLLRLVVLLSAATPRWRRIAALHRDQGGAVQSLSFVLTLPFFVMIVLFIVQVSQLMIGTVVVHYAAYAGARSAVVWIPARLTGGFESENRISWYRLDPEAPDQVFPILDPGSPEYGPTAGGLTFIVEPGTPKYDKVASAAVLACMPIAPSRDLGIDVSPDLSRRVDVLRRVYRQNASDYGRNPQIAARLENKLAYAARATEVEIRFFHSNHEPPLVPYHIGPDEMEFHFNEVGFQDPVTVRVTHYMALLPGPGRLLARSATRPDGLPDDVAATIRQVDGLYVYPLSASATLGNEGEKSVIPYTYDWY